MPDELDKFTPASPILCQIVRNPDITFTQILIQILSNLSPNLYPYTTNAIKRRNIFV